MLTVEQSKELMEAFPFGKAVKEYRVSSFSVIEYVDNDTKETLFSPFLNFDDSATPCDTLDQAIVTGMAIKYDGQGTDADRMIQRMLDM